MLCALEINGNGGLKRGHVESCSSTTINISNATIPVVTKLGRVLTYHVGLPPIKLHDLLITRLAKSRDKLKSLLNPLPEWLWPNLA